MPFVCAVVDSWSDLESFFFLKEVMILIPEKSVVSNPRRLPQKSPENIN